MLGGVGYGLGLVWPPVSDAFVPSSIICVVTRRCGVAFGGLADYPSFHSVESLVRAE